MNLLEQQRLEIEALKSKLKEQEKKIALQEKEIAQKKEKLASGRALEVSFGERAKQVGTIKLLYPSQLTAMATLW